MSRFRPARWAVAASLAVAAVMVACLAACTERQPPLRCVIDQAHSRVFALDGTPLGAWVPLWDGLMLREGDGFSYWWRRSGVVAERPRPVYPWIPTATQPDGTSAGGVAALVAVDRVPESSAADPAFVGSWRLRPSAPVAGATLTLRSDGSAAWESQGDVRLGRWGAIEGLLWSDAPGPMPLPPMYVRRQTSCFDVRATDRLKDVYKGGWTYDRMR